MARLPRLCLPGIPQHIIQRGTNRQICFAANEDMAAYAYWLDEYARKYQVIARPEDYHWSSYQANATGVISRLISHHSVYLGLGVSSSERQMRYRALFKAHFDPADLERIRDVTHRGLVLGDERFVQEVEKLAGRRVRPLKRGPRARTPDSGELLL